MDPKDVMIAKMFGQNRGRDLSREPSPVRGPGNERSDQVPAVTIPEAPGEQEAPAQLSKGEFVIPAATVLQVGEGNAERGAAIFQELVDQIAARNAGPAEPVEEPQEPASFEGLKSLS